MPAFSTLFAALSTKGVAAAAAGTLMVGGGVAVAQSVPPDVTPDVTPDDVPEDVVPDLDEIPDDIGPTGVEEETVEEETPDSDENLGEIQNLELDGDLEEDEGPEDPEIENAEEGERSETAKAVHRALTGYVEGEEEITPGHPDFGATVSARAREGGLGKAVSEAARSANPGNGGQPDAANNGDNGRTDGEQDIEPVEPSSTTSDEAGPPENAGPPAGKGKVAQ